MKRMHVHVSVTDLDHAVGFYAALFAAEPSVRKEDYAKWMLDDPCVNFAISTRSREPGLDHLGIQVENAGELRDVYGRLRRAGGVVSEQGSTTCCYAQSEKSWVDDPAGIAWEAFHTTGEATDYGSSVQHGAQIAHANSCCAPQANIGSSKNASAGAESPPVT
jgi:Glyoxalase/Bleomycin resistance protein/Dioxygenase superfamily